MTLSPVQRRSAWLLMILSALIVAVGLAVPLFVIRPFVPQDPHQLALALTMRRSGPWVSAVCALLAGGVLMCTWHGLSAVAKVGYGLLLFFTFTGACLTHVNIFERMFKPYGAAAFDPASAAPVGGNEMVLAVNLNGIAHAYPIRTMGYHHIVNDDVDGQPIAVTYCTLCHTGLVWSRRMVIPMPAATACACVLTFRLAGINNGNALLRDEQTSSVWQQSTGEAIFGPLKGSQLTLIHSDELTFALWRSEQPNGKVLKPQAQYAAEYEPEDWEARIEHTRAVVDTENSGIRPHELMLGVTLNAQSKAFPLRQLYAAGLIGDRLGSTPVLLLVGPDGVSIRAFAAQLPDEKTALTFVRSSHPNVLMSDTESGSTWNFRGCATFGKYAGRCLTSIDVHKDYWFDWLNHNPATTVYKG